MPELPDLNVFAKNLNKRFSNKRLKTLNVQRPNKLKDATVAQFKEKFEGEILHILERDGKELIFKFENNEYFSMHLMLKGYLSINEDNLDLFSSKKTIDEIKHKTLSLIFEDESFIALSDPLNWANITYMPKKSLTPDAEHDEITFDYIKNQLLKERENTLKSFLINQDVIRGIGNAYADEILWDCKIHPESKCEKLPESKINELILSIKKVLLEAERKILEHNPNLISGEIRDFLIVHNKTKKTTPFGEEIKIKEISGKTTYFTDSQKLFL